MLSYKAGLGVWFHDKIVYPLLQILQRGLEPKQLAFSVALGITLGIFPVCGVTVFLCGMAITVLGSRCHPPSVLLVNFLATPIELSLVVPFLRLGEALSGGSHFPLTSDALKKVLTGNASMDVFLSIGHAVLGWFVAAPFVLTLLYLFFLPCLKLVVSRMGIVPEIAESGTPNHPDVKVKIRHA